MCHLFFSIASHQPLLLFLDDLQWAPSLEVLQALAQQASSHPLLLVGAYRDP
jgi:predicted ATPase